MIRLANLVCIIYYSSAILNQLRDSPTCNLAGSLNLSMNIKLLTIGAIVGLLLVNVHELTEVVRFEE